MPLKREPHLPAQGQETRRSQRTPAAHVLRAIAGPGLGGREQGLPPPAVAQGFRAAGPGRAMAPHVQAMLSAGARAQGAAARPSAVQPMSYNIGTSLTTQHGSKYTVSEGEGLRREKYYEATPSINPKKKIFYGDEATTAKCLRARDRCDGYSLVAYKFGTYLIRFWKNGGLLYEGHLQAWPEVGLYPVDMILSENDTWNESMEFDDRFHVGDRITAIG